MTREASDSLILKKKANDKDLRWHLFYALIQENQLQDS